MLHDLYIIIQYGSTHHAELIFPAKTSKTSLKFPSWQHWLSVKMIFKSSIKFEILEILLTN